MYIHVPARSKWKCTIQLCLYCVCIVEMDGWMDGGENYWRQSEWGWTNRRFYIDAVDSIAVLPVCIIQTALALLMFYSQLQHTARRLHTSTARFVYKMYSVQLCRRCFVWPRSTSLLMTIFTRMNCSEFFHLKHPQRHRRLSDLFRWKVFSRSPPNYLTMST